MGNVDEFGAFEVGDGLGDFNDFEIGARDKFQYYNFLEYSFITGFYRRKDWLCNTSKTQMDFPIRGSTLSPA